MSWRVVVIHTRARLELKLGYLVVRGTETRRVLLDEISVLMVENPGCVVSAALLSAMWQKKIAVIFCDARHNPGAQLVPLYGSHDCSARIRDQLAWDPSVKQMIWADIIREKIRRQAAVLHRHKDGDDWQRVLLYSDQVEPGDATNREAHAAKVYFNSLLGAAFSRSVPSFINSALDYGYSIVLSIVNRTVVASGYMTQIGIFHHSTFNHFNLSSDIMEPYRPLVDEKVLSLPIDEELSHERKMQIVSLLNDLVSINGKQMTVLLAIEISTRSVLAALEAGNPELMAFYEA